MPSQTAPVGSSVPNAIGRRFFRWQGQTYGRPDDGLALAMPNPWNPQRVLYLYLANSSLELWHMIALVAVRWSAQRFDAGAGSGT